ncbi:zinc finger protein 540 [Anoplophora glabripennis]|nr:zinc finger protein 540 [Anoplophora glabripennis]
MRHLEKIQPDSTAANLDENKTDLFETFAPEIKEEIPSFMLDENFMKTEFSSDEESIMGANLTIDIKNDSDGSEELDSPSKFEVKKNKRKASAPQRAVQLELSQSSSVGNSSESSQDHIDNLKFSNNQNLDDILAIESETGLDFAEGDEIDDDLLHDINDVDIFKDLQEEADGETIDDEIIDNVKEEWRAHWGVKCNMCEQVFPYKTEFDKHYVSTYNLSPVYTCTFCNKSAEKYSTFRSHCYRHITEGRYKCQECPKGFSLQSMLQVHVLAKHTKAKPFMCEECGKSFVTKPGLKIHLKKHKTETKEDYPCVECGKVLHTRGGLTSHMNVHRLGRRFMCDVCGKTFTQKVNMQQHVKQHTGDKPHSCAKCGKTFAEKSHLARHYSFHSEERPYKCEVCQKMYKTERCLKVHSLVHAAARPFVCGYCSKGFLSSTKLKQHYNIHTGERPYKCKYCERTFTNYPNWLKHTRRRHKVDHKTGAELEPKVPKEEAPPTPAPVVESVLVPEASVMEPLPLLSDVSLSKAEELLLQQSLLNFPLLDDKIIFNQQMDFLTGTANNSVGLLVPYFQSTLPNHQTIIQHTTQTALPIQFGDLLHVNYAQQTLPCD